MANYMGSKWDSTTNGVGATVTWSFAELNYAELTGQYGSYTNFDSPIGAAYRAAVIAAFDAWEAVANIDFTMVTDSALSDIRVGNAYIDGIAALGQSSVLAQARYWYNGGGIVKAQLYFDADSYTRDWFFQIALHEIGHTIGIAHADDPNSVMYYQMSGQNSDEGLTADDISAAQTLYGAKVTSPTTLTPPTPPVTPSAPAAPPEASFMVSALNADAAEAAAGGLTFQVRRSGDTAVAATLDWRLQAGSASLADFSGITAGVLTFAAGETVKTITVSASDDTVFETDESFAVWILNPTTGSVTQAIATGVIRNDDARPVVRMAAAPLTTDETAGVLRIEITRTGGGEPDTVVRWAVTPTGKAPAGAADFAGGRLPGGEVVFAPGETSRWIEIALNDDNLLEEDEGFLIELTGADVADIQGASRLVILQDDDRSGPLFGNMGADTLVGGSRSDQLYGLTGNDRLDGRGGFDSAVYSGGVRDYGWWSNPDGTWTVQDLRPYAPDGRDTLISIEELRFRDSAVKIAGATGAEALDQAQSHVLRLGASAVGESTLTGGGSLAASLAQVIQAAQNTSSVATLSYQFFTGAIPTQLGMDYLVSPAGPNAANLNSAYYQGFNLENRYINFAVNLGREGEGKAKFLADYGGLSLAEATKKAYAVIFGGMPTDAKVVALLANGRDAYFESYGKDGPSGQGTKAAMVGWLLAEAVKADVGAYAKANTAFLTDLTDGAQFGVDLIGVYGKVEFNYVGG